MSEKTYGEIAREAHDKADDWEEVAESVIAEFLKRNGEPVAWAVFADNGNTRIWFSDYEQVKKWATENNCTDKLTPLFTSPQPLQSAEGKQ